MSVLKKILIACAILAVSFMALLMVWAMSLGYFPGLGKVFGLGGAQDLQVEYTDADLISVREKLEVAVAGQVVEQSFTDSELTALLNACTTSVCVFDDIQLKTLVDGQVEIAGVIEKDRLIDLLSQEDLLEGNDEDIRAMAKYLPARPAFYIKTGMSGADDVMTLNISEASLAGIKAPEENLRQLEVQLSDSWSEYLQSLEGIQVSQLRVSEDGVYVEADLNELDEEALGL